MCQVLSAKYLHAATNMGSVAYAENFHGGGFIQWHMVVISI